MAKSLDDRGRGARLARREEGLLAMALAASCGYHDTPVATYHAPLPDVPVAGTGPGAGSGAEGAMPSAAGEQAGGSAGESAAGMAGATPGPACLQTYPLLVPGLTSRYKQSDIGQKWVDAERDCESEGAHLVVIDDEAENTWLGTIAASITTDSASTNKLTWLGFSDHVKEGEFRWVTGAPLSSTFWSPSEPNSLNGYEDCGEMRASSTWNDDRCNARLFYVCECDGIPSAGQWCDTDTVATCGDCSTSCTATQTCVSQICK
jgi:hypothetical protein